MTVDRQPRAVCALTTVGPTLAAKWPGCRDLGMTSARHASYERMDTDVLTAWISAHERQSASSSAADNCPVIGTRRMQFQHDD